MKRLIKRILREEINKSDKHYRILDKISDYVEIPYFESMEGLTIYDKDDQEYIMKKIYGNDIYIRGDVIRDDKGKIIYFEYSDGRWKKWEYNDKGNMIYYKHSNGFWGKWEYDENEYQIYEERSDGFWKRYEYDDRGNIIYWETSNGDIRDNR